MGVSNLFYFFATLSDTEMVHQLINSDGHVVLIVV